MEYTICEYLGEKFNTFTFEDLVNHFLTEFGVRVKKYENKYLFKYDQILADFSKEITHQCRGVILYYIDGKWSYHSKPFTKFFNLSQGMHPWFDETILKRDLPNIRLYEKKDGSCIQVASDLEHGNVARASTLGSIQTESVFDDPLTFSDLFWKLAPKNIKFIKGETYLFEMCAQSNQVVTVYDTEHVSLLAIRRANDEFYTKEECDKFAEENGISRPAYIDRIFTSKEEIETFVEDESKNEDKYGKIPEGFVAYMGRPIFKCKNEKYHQYHLINTGDRRYVRKNLVEAFFAGNIDDIYGNLTQDNKDFVDRLRSEVLRLEEFFKVIFFALEGINDRKAYALKVMGMSKINKDVAMFRGILFEYLGKIMAGEYVSFVEAVSNKKSNYTTIDHFRFL